MSLPPGEKTICFPLSRPRRAVIEERLPCPERPEASVGYEASIAGCPEVRIAGLRGSSKGFVALRVSLPLGKNMVYVPCSGGAPSASHPRRVVVEEGVLCPERRKASVDYEATIAGCRGQDSRAERELEGVGGTRRCATAPLATFGGPGLPLAALPDTDRILAPHAPFLGPASSVPSLKSNIGAGLVFGGQVNSLPALLRNSRWYCAEIDPTLPSLVGDST